MPSFDVNDTIAAIASASGPGVRGILRITGPNCRAYLNEVFIPQDTAAWEGSSAISAIPGAIRIGHETFLPGRLLHWPTDRSYTRQPSAEFHTIGSPPLLKRALASLCQAGARLANPGEFTLRAFLSGRLDLPQAEAVLAIIDAEKKDQLDDALKQLAGGLSGPLTETRDQLKLVLAELEAGLDFAEEDIEFISQSDLLRRLEAIHADIKKITDQIKTRDHETNGVRVVLTGLPNAGKSSLFNQLLGDQRALVTHVAGTTTDFLVGSIIHHQHTFELVDTAGAEANPPDQSISEQAQAQRSQIESTAQIKLLCLDASRTLTDWEREQLDHRSDTTIVVLTKTDLVETVSDEATFGASTDSQTWIKTSSHRGTGTEALLDRIADQIETIPHAAYQIVDATISRASESLRATEQSVQSAIQAVQRKRGDEIVAAEIRESLDHLGWVVGTVYTDDILDIVFGRFCIGK